MLNDDYLSEFEDYAARLKRSYPAVHKMYLVGNCSAPGVSDIDTLMVLGSEARSWMWRAMPASQYGYSHLFHGPFVTTEDYLPDLLLATTLKINGDVGDGRGGELPDATDGENDYLAIVRTSFFLSHFNKRVDDIIEFSRTSERYFLLVTNSFSYTVQAALGLSEAFDVEGHGRQAMSNYCALVRKARNHWVAGELSEARSEMAQIAAVQRPVVATVNELMNRVVAGQCESGGSVRHFTSVRDRARRLTSIKSGGREAVDQDGVFSPSLSQAIDVFSSVMAKHVRLYRDRNLYLYGAEFPLPGLGVSISAPRPVQLISRVIGKLYKVAGR